MTKESRKNDVKQLNNDVLVRKTLLHNAILKAIKEYGTGMQIGLVRAVIAEVDGEIIRMESRELFDSICGKLKEINPDNPRGCWQHPRADA